MAEDCEILWLGRRKLNEGTVSVISTARLSPFGNIRSQDTPHAICYRHPRPRNHRSQRSRCRRSCSSKSGSTLLRLREGGISRLLARTDTRWPVRLSQGLWLGKSGTLGSSIDTVCFLYGVCFESGFRCPARRGNGN